MIFTLETLEVYNEAELFSDKIWNIVDKWDYFKKDTIGKQLTRAADSISANIAEGYGDIIIKRANNFISIREAPFRKQKLGCQNVCEGIS